MKDNSNTQHLNWKIRSCEGICNWLFSASFCLKVRKIQVSDFGRKLDFAPVCTIYKAGTKMTWRLTQHRWLWRLQCPLKYGKTWNWHSKEWPNVGTEPPSCIIQKINTIDKVILNMLNWRTWNHHGDALNYKSQKTDVRGTT